MNKKDSNKNKKVVDKEKKTGYTVEDLLKKFGKEYSKNKRK